MNANANNVNKKSIKRGLQHIATSFDHPARSNSTPTFGMRATLEASRQYITILKQYFNIIKLSDRIQLKPDAKEPPYGVCTIIFNTCHHARLNKHTLKELLESEIVGHKDIIEKHIGLTAKIFCFSHNDFCPGTSELLRQNSTGAFTALSGWM